MSDRQIIYEPHPVSLERKAELREQGYTIIDARFKPAEAAPLAEPAVEKAPRGRRAKNEG
jgi:hypothetical protein